MTSAFPEIRFDGQLRPTQREIEAIARQELAVGNRRLHIVAPPGTGKTVVGLYLWSQLVRRPAVVLSPNSAIQAQWVARTSMFSQSERADGGSLRDVVSTSADEPGLLTSLTYQSITLPASATEAMDEQAIEYWVESLIAQDQAHSRESARIWIEDLRLHNPGYFKDRLRGYRAKIRDEQSRSGNAIGGLHASSLDALAKLRGASVGLLIMDECHHLMGHWGRVLSEVAQYLADPERGAPVVVGLTATPPDRGGRTIADIQRYDEFFGDVDYEAPVPAIVKDGYLAPYQDLAYFVRPTENELKFIAQVDQQFESLLEQLCQPRPVVDVSDGSRHQRESLLEWLWDLLRDHSATAADWSRFQRRDPEFVEGAVRFLESRLGQLPDGVPPCVPGEIDGELMVRMIDRYTRRCLRRSPDPDDHELAILATRRCRTLGVQITETGSRACASPVSRVIAYTNSKTDALVPILRMEQSNLGGAVRAVVIADYVSTSAVTAEISHLLDSEAGGAVAAFRSVLSDKRTNELDPILLTGSTVLVDQDLVSRFMEAASTWLEARGFLVRLGVVNRGAFCTIKGSGADWCPRVYVEMITDLFQQGLTRCLVGTRGLLGEGWDAESINVLIDLSTFTTSTTVNQLRGRSIRLDPEVPRKVANNWDVVCIAPEFAKGLDDYTRFKRKHKTVFGICDDGAIEKGVGHVHAAFLDLKPELLDDNVEDLNKNMLRRSSHREQAYDQWQVGQPYSAVPIPCVEMRGRFAADEFPPFKESCHAWTNQRFANAIASVVLESLVDVGLIARSVGFRVTERDGGFVRVYLTGGDRDAAVVFAASIRDALGPMHDARYVIERSAEYRSTNMLIRILPAVIGRLLQKRELRPVALHAVPAALAGKRQLVDAYQRHWNAAISPGEAVYRNNPTGGAIVNEAIKYGRLPNISVHEKEVFL